MKGKILVVDDDKTLRFALVKALRRFGYDTREAADGLEALRALRETLPDVVLLDLRMPELDGLGVLRRFASRAPAFIVLTGHGTVQAAVEAMRLGAFSFLEKPVDAEVLRPTLEQALALRASGALGKQATRGHELIARSAAMREVDQMLDRIAPTDETVAIFGETGTGKEVVARQVHQRSLRRGGPYVALNAACVPKDLFESELFGHRKGAFTGATQDHRGFFLDAHGGSLFIDEVGELPLDSQAKLLRALESKRIRAVGDSQEREVDVRIIVATNRDLWREVQRGTFREDLYFRLQVFPVTLPPLRNRLADLPDLCAALLLQVSRQGALHIGEQGLKVLSAHPWPGNVRELLNVLRRAALFASDGELGPELLQKMLAASLFTKAQGGGPAASERGSQERPGSSFPPADTAQTTLAAVEREHIFRVLEGEDGNVTRAAIALGIDRRTLQRKMRQYDLTGDTD